MGEGSNWIEDSGGENNCFGSSEAHYVGICPKEDRGGTAGTVGKGKSGEESSLTYGARMKPATSVAGFLFDEESLRVGYQMS
jgi:hypothetical protein